MAQRAHAGQAARERFLIAASEKLQISSSTISARLASQFLDIVDGSSSTSRGPLLCKGCGSHIITGWSCKKISLRANSRQRKQASKTARRVMHELKPVGYYFLQCDGCGTKTPVSSPEISRGRRPQSGTRPGHKASDSKDKSGTATATVVDTSPRKPVEVITQAATQDNEVRPAELPAISKKRPRSKKTSGLQALLAQRKADSKGPSLDLMDFMKGA